MPKVPSYRPTDTTIVGLFAKQYYEVFEAYKTWVRTRHERDARVFIWNIALLIVSDKFLVYSVVRDVVRDLDVNVGRIGPGGSDHVAIKSKLLTLPPFYSPSYNEALDDVYDLVRTYSRFVLEDLLPALCERVDENALRRLLLDYGSASRIVPNSGGWNTPSTSLSAKQLLTATRNVFLEHLPPNRLVSS